MKSRFLLNVVVGQCTTIFELLTSKDQTLLIRWNTFLVLNFGFDVFDSVGGFDIKCDCFSGKSFDKNLHAVMLVVCVVDCCCWHVLVERKKGEKMSVDVSENEDHHYFRKTEKQQKLVASTTKQHQQSDIKLHKCCDNLAKRLRGR